jgi:hypothetical protein
VSVTLLDGSFDSIKFFKVENKFGEFLLIFYGKFEHVTGYGSYSVFLGWIRGSMCIKF